MEIKVSFYIETFFILKHLTFFKKLLLNGMFLIRYDFARLHWKLFIALVLSE